MDGGIRYIEIGLQKIACPPAMVMLLLVFPLLWPSIRFLTALLKTHILKSLLSAGGIIERFDSLFSQ
jgi:hypothetical protein